MADNRQYLTGLYQTQLNRAPDAAGLDYWEQQMAGGMSPYQVRANFSNLPEGQVNGAYGSILERTPDAGGLEHFLANLPQGGVAGMRQQMLQSPEYQNRIGDDWGFYRSQARQATAGINAMPGVHSDFAAPWAVQGGQGGLQQLQSLLNFGPAQAQPPVPALSSLIDGAFPEALAAAKKEKDKTPAKAAADKAAPALGSILRL